MSEALISLIPLKPSFMGWNIDYEGGENHFKLINARLQSLISSISINTQLLDYIEEITIFDSFFDKTINEAYIKVNEFAREVWFEKIDHYQSRITETGESNHIERWISEPSVDSN